MHLAYSALKDNKSQPTTPGGATNHNQLRLQAYYAACNKYSKEITAIQKYLPGWVPPFPAL